VEYPEVAVGNLGLFGQYELQETFKRFSCPDKRLTVDSSLFPNQKMGVKKKTLLLINPVDPLRVSIKKVFAVQYPPLSLAIIAALTPPDWKVKIIDENFQNFHFREADLVGFTVLTSSAPRAYELAKIYREKGIPTVIGGIHASMCTEEAKKYVDTVVIGEAETVWKGLLEDFDNGSLKPVYQGTYQLMKGYPIPRHEIYHPKYLIHSVQTTRGCPLDCDFCTVTAFNGKSYRLRPVEEVLDELEMLQGDNRTILFVDDNIIGTTKAHQDRAITLFKGIVERGIKIEWFTQTSIDIAENEEALKWAAKSGCRMLYIGIESENEEGLKSANKVVNLKKGVKNYHKAFKTIHKYGICILGSFIFGLESDTKKDLQKRARFLVRSNIDAYQVNILTPFPGTRVFDRLNAEGRILRNNFPEDWCHYRAFDIVFRHPNITHEEFANTMVRSWKIVYHPALIFFRLFRTWFNTGSLKTAMWAYHTNHGGRDLVFERTLSTFD
jgi:radical SAM superfamily enzyme YgiQ (UPF0313 family)